MTDIVIIAHNIRSTHNVGAFFRTADGFGIQHLYLTGYTPYPTLPVDSRLPHLSQKLTQQIHKTALGAEETLAFSYSEDPTEIIAQLKQEGFTILALEQTPEAILLPSYKVPQEDKIALVLGEEVEGIPAPLLALVDQAIEIPMQGRKESFNVSVACGIALYALRFQ